MFKNTTIQLKILTNGALLGFLPWPGIRAFVRQSVELTHPRSVVIFISKWLTFILGLIKVRSHKKENL
ncbi:hypothetical protein JI62_15550 [Halomonas campaniensis]|uniref:Uncharacterized protein n=1 Tax=Halomonas campaniensis TaxID=213554 RepID=A0A246RYH5_9GAMM|nr:hypothetical protein JI62_15550 [Halomonas campaniensis]